MAAAREPVIAGNWKMNGLLDDGCARAEAVLAGADGLSCGLVICPPATLLQAVGAVLKGSDVALGAQDCHAMASGAHTGDISAAMIADIGCSHVIVGHSERRADHGEDSALVSVKAEAAHAANLTAIICVGEMEDHRVAGHTLAVVDQQVTESLPDNADEHNTIIAYEPVWAIGTGRTPTQSDIQEVHQHIRAVVGGTLGTAAGDGMRILYGGSVKPENAQEILAIADVDGALVGGASLDANDFLSIAQSCP